MEAGSCAPSSQSAEQMNGLDLPDDRNTIRENAAQPSMIRESTVCATDAALKDDDRRDTVFDFSPPTEKPMDPLHVFLAGLGIPDRTAYKSLGVTTIDGRKLDLIVYGDGVIRFEYDIPIIIEGTARGWTRYDLIFSAFTGDCVTYNFRDEFDFDAASESGKNMKNQYCLRQRPDWKAILLKFEEEFKNANLY